jgi:hypothetical protein
MNCREFNEVLNELASDRLLDALARKRALVHAGGCEVCARQLATQRALSAGLIEFAEMTGRELPPERIRQQLRAAVAERRATPVVASVPATVLLFKPVAKTHWQRQALAAAAAVLVLFTVSLLLLRQSNNPEKNDLANGVTPTPHVAPASIQTPVVNPTPPTPPTPLIDPQPREQLASQQVTKRRPVRRARVIEPRADEQELASEFVPLTMDTDERALANGTLVRLEVPRARLIAMGLPLRVEADRDTISAEVMMGDNGVAYAIRVVR